MIIFHFFSIFSLQLFHKILKNLAGKNNENFLLLYFLSTIKND